MASQRSAGDGNGERFVSSGRAGALRAPRCRVNSRWLVFAIIAAASFAASNARAAAAAATRPPAAAGAPPALAASGSCRDGRPHGAYQLRGSDGTLRVAGAFNRGKRTSSFIFWSPRGVRIAQIPYDEGRWSGTMSLWYADATRGGDPQVKVESAYAEGRLNGETRSWYPNGALRAVLLYDRGTLVSAKAWSTTGAPLPEAQAKALAGRDSVADARYYESLETIVDRHPPACNDAGDAPRSARASAPAGGERDAREGP